MAAEDHAPHYGREELNDYLMGRLPEEEAVSLETHLGTCERCMEQVGRLSSLHSLRHGWTAQAHQQAYLRARLEGALEQVEQGDLWKAWRARVAEWRRRSGSQVSAAWRVAVASGGKLSRAVSEGLEWLWMPAAPGQFAFQAAGVAARPGIRTRGAVGTEPTAQVAITGNDLDIRIEGAAFPKAPLVMVIPLAEEEAAPRVQKLQSAPGAETPQWVAHFSNLPPGDYLVVFEPAEGAGDADQPPAAR